MEHHIDLSKIGEQTKQGLTEMLSQSNFKAGDIFVLGMSTSEVQGKHIGKHPSLDVAHTIVNTIHHTLKPLGIHLAVQGCEHLNRALVVERSVAEANNLEIVTVFPQVHAGGSGQIAAFEAFEDPVEVEHIVAAGGMDIGDTSIGMHVKFVQIPVRTSITEIGDAHVTYLKSRPKLIGGARAKYEWDPFDTKHPVNQYYMN
ncbi:TIGR01440 family protein [Ligilactobacillus saerimneri]|uniref:TIGR01440 family protein n=1 Tax=Ligilactobacillus saerimneri TaxID=228229 RepID=UPI0015DE6C9B|nr:TIGR01440 family protein [Ligilactobacillus saerimneri]